MNEKKEDITGKRVQGIDLESIKTKKSFSGFIKNFFNKIKKRTEIFIEYQLPSLKNNITSWFKSFRGVLILFCLVLVSIIPFLLDESLYFRIFMLAMIYAIYAASWDLLAGITGQVSFGHAAFFGVGAYVSAALIKYMELNWFFSLLLGPLVGVLFGLIIAIPCLRLKGPYLALGTLAYSLLLLSLFSMNALKDIFYGNRGITNILIFLRIDIEYRFIFTLIIMVISIVILLAISNSNLGMIFNAIRDDERSTKASGVNVLKYKIIAFMISSFFAGLAGSIYMLDQTKVDPFIFLPTYSFYPVVMACLGGIGLISGSVFGAYFFVLVAQILEEIILMIGPAEYTEFLTALPLAIFGIILIIVVRFTERGLMEPTIEKTKILYDLVIGK